MTSVDRIPVPRLDAPWSTVSRFATSFNGYEYFDGVMDLGDASRSAHEAWAASGVLPSDVDELRACLFFEQRRVHHGFPFDFDVDRAWAPENGYFDDWALWVRALVSAMAERTDGYVDPGPSRPESA